MVLVIVGAALVVAGLVAAVATVRMARKLQSGLMGDALKGVTEGMDAGSRSALHSPEAMISGMMGGMLGASDDLFARTRRVNLMGALAAGLIIVGIVLGIIGLV